MKIYKLKKIGLIIMGGITTNMHYANNPTPFDVLGSSFEFKQQPIQKTIDKLTLANKETLFNDVYKKLTKDFNITKVDFYKAWANAISRTQGGEIIKSQEPIKLKFGEEEIDLNLRYTPQLQLSGFIGDKNGIKHYSSVIQNSNLLKGKVVGSHAVNLWQQDIEVAGQKMQFLRHGCTRGNENATKEILLNALILQYGKDTITDNITDNTSLELKFANVQLMSLGPIADQKMPLEQIDAFNKLFEKFENNIVELEKKDGKTINIKCTKPLLFNFGVNLQHFKEIEKKLADSDDKKKLEDQNLKSFKRLFGENFPNLTIKNGILRLEENCLIQEALNHNDEQTKKQIKTLAKQIFTIYLSQPEGLKENPYALPIRVLALTNLLGYTSSFNCKSGKDRTGICAIELANLCAQIMSNKNISNPTDTISKEEKKNLQAIYKKGFSARDIIRINNVFQKNLNVQEYLGFDANRKRFGIDWKKSFEENIEILEKESQ